MPCIRSQEVCECWLQALTGCCTRAGNGIAADGDAANCQYVSKNSTSSNQQSHVQNG